MRKFRVSVFMVRTPDTATEIVFRSKRVIERIAEWFLNALGNKTHKNKTNGRLVSRRATTIIRNSRTREPRALLYLRSPRRAFLSSPYLYTAIFRCRYVGIRRARVRFYVIRGKTSASITNYKTANDGSGQRSYAGR